MAIDTSIYGLAGKVKSVADYDREALLADEARQQQQMTAMQIMAGQQKQQEYVRGVQRADALRQLAGRWKADTTDEQRIVDLKNSGFAAEADAAEKAFLERQKAGADVSAKKATTTKQEIDNQITRMGTIINVISGAKDQASYSQGRALLAQNGFDVSQVPEQFDPAYVSAAGQQALTALQRMQEERQRLADEERKRSNLVNEKTAAGNLAVAQGNLGVARDRLKFDQTQPKGQIIETADGFMVADPRAGTAAPVTAGGVPVKSKAAGAAQTQKVQEANEAIQLINQAEPLLKGATGGYIGSAVDTIAQAFSIATPGAIKAQQLKAIEGALVAKMPKMSGPQSDKDVALYRQMAAAIGDPTVPYEQKVAALEQVRTIQERYAGVTQGSSKPSPQKGGGKVIDFSELP
jgi:hypothetical protein